MAEMLGDYFTKPLQGGIFNKFRDRVLNIQVDPSTVPLEDHRSVLGQDRSHATEQLHGQSLGTAQHDQTQCPKPANETIVDRDEQPQDKPIVHAVMMPMSLLVGGWHMTSMTKHPRGQNVPRPCPRLVEPTQ